MICPNCGMANADGSAYCEQCGARLVPSAVPASAGPVPAPSAHPSPAPSPIAPIFGADPTSLVRSETAMDQSGAIPGPADVGTDGVRVRRTARRRALIALLVALVAAVVASALVLAGVLTYRAGIWGSRTIPAITVAGANGAGGSAASTATAKQVADQLKGQGFETTIVTAYAVGDKGSYVGLTSKDGRALNPGDKVKGSDAINVIESLGPGVPKGTVGSSAQDAYDAVKNMGVDVHVKDVLVSPDSTVKEGDVVQTYPADGQPVQDKNQGIHIGVATQKGDGIPADILGKDQDDVRSQLEANGHNVTLKPRFSSKRYVGKISGSNPTPGAELEAGQDVTLYYGIDASKTWDVFTTNDPQYPTVDYQANPGSFVAGHYCTNAGQCISLDLSIREYTAMGEHRSQEYVTVDGQSDRSSGSGFDRDQLVACYSLQSNCQSPSEAASSNDASELLLYKDWGMFEMFPYRAMSGYWCGDTQTQFNGPGQSCVNGRLTSWSELGGAPSSSGISGAQYRMDDYYVYFPVGSDLQKLEDSGYFDKDSLAAAKKQKAVDADRPFIIVRDTSQYDTTTKDITSSSDGNPFMPKVNAYSNDSLEPMKPAPSDETVYYLQEDALDWTELPDADVPGADGAKD